MFRRVLVANRGEIAVRVIRACREEGLSAVAVYAADDAGSLHARAADGAVDLGDGEPAGTYLSIPKLLDAARRAGCEAVHPGYGFLSESAAFADAVAGAGLAWIGPPARAIADLGNKRRAKEIAAAAGVAANGGASLRGLSDEACLEAARKVGFPVLIKAAAGGGGKGMQKVQEPGAFLEALQRARREAMGAFGDDELLLERFLERPRHVEVQILADAHGGVVALGERDCSVQRRHQKILEETPAPLLSDEERWQLHRAAERLAEQARYASAGTVEFLREGEGRFSFLEVNTRVQVEHPVTEMATGIDIVRWQLRIARGERLTFSRQDVRPRGHAIEARICAEDPDRDFLPSPGRILRWEPPSGPGIRVDAGIAAGQAAGLRYDSLLAKVIAWGETREAAIGRLDRALAETRLAGCVTNVGILRDVLASDAFRRAELSIDFLARHREELSRLRGARRREAAAIAAALPASASSAQAQGASAAGAAPARRRSDPFDGARLGEWRLGGG